MARDHLFNPPISASPEAAHFWEAAAEHRLEIPFCNRCERAFFYPRVLCPTCGSRDVTWRVAIGTGTLYSFTVQYRSAVPGLADAVPFITGLVDLDEGPRMMTIITGIPPDPDCIRCGIRVEASFLDVNDRQALPVFRPVQDGPVPS